MKPPRIAIPMPHSANPEYAERAIPQYELAVKLAGGEPVRIPLDQSAADVKKMIERCDGVLLPGSNADVDPARFKAARSPHTAAADSRRDAVDDLLLADAYNLRKPVLGICYGLQSLNVFRAGSLIQHIPDFLPEETRAKVNHAAGKKVEVAHTVEIEPDSKLAQIVAGTSGAKAQSREEPAFAALEALRHPKALHREALQTDSLHTDSHRIDLRHSDSLYSDSRQTESLSPISGNPMALIVPVNSSHHQSAEVAGKSLRIVARCPDDGIIEALEGTAPDHFVVAVQWHPERSVDADAASRAIFHALIESAAQRP